MKVQGKYSIVGSTKDIWTHLMDPEVLKRITPGISALSRLDDDKYKAISNIKIGPVKATFDGQLEFRNVTEQESATIVISQKSKIGNVSAEILMQLNANNGNTEIDYQGEAKLSGKLSLMGQRLIGGVISSLSKEFFKALDKEINANK